MEPEKIIRENFILAFQIDNDELLDGLIEYHKNSDEYKKYLNKALQSLSKAIPMWVKYANLNPKQSWMVIHLLKDGLFALDRFSEFEDILKQIIKIDRDYIDSIASLSEILLHRGEETEAERKEEERCSACEADKATEW